MGKICSINDAGLSAQNLPRLVVSFKAVTFDKERLVIHGYVLLERLFRRYR